MPFCEAGAINLRSANPYRYGDANLDGVVDGSDFNIWNNHKFTSVAAWSKGDFNADGVVDGSDFNLWNTNKFTSADDFFVVMNLGTNERVGSNELRVGRISTTFDLEAKTDEWKLGLRTPG